MNGGVMNSTNFLSENPCHVAYNTGYTARFSLTQIPPKEELRISLTLYEISISRRDDSVGSTQHHPRKSWSIAKKSDFGGVIQLCSNLFYQKFLIDGR